MTASGKCFPWIGICFALPQTGKIQWVHKCLCSCIQHVQQAFTCYISWVRDCVFTYVIIIPYLLIYCKHANEGVHKNPFSQCSVFTPSRLCVISFQMRKMYAAYIASNSIFLVYHICAARSCLFCDFLDRKPPSVSLSGLLCLYLIEISIVSFICAFQHGQLRSLCESNDLLSCF